MNVRRTYTGWAVAGIALIAAGILTGCSGSAAPTSSTTAAIDVDAAWLDGGRLIGVVTWGSSSCVPFADAASLSADGALQVSLNDPASVDGATQVACTADYAPRISVVGVPEGVDPAKGVDVHVTYGSGVGDVALAGAQGLTGVGTPTDYAPSAGWTGRPGMFAYLTWGSSTCAPVVKDVAATGDAQVTVTFVEPAADRACTMDMAPRAALAEVQGLTTPAGAHLVLTGDAYSGVNVPIAGGS